MNANHGPWPLSTWLYPEDVRLRPVPRDLLTDGMNGATNRNKRLLAGGWLMGKSFASADFRVGVERVYALYGDWGLDRKGFGVLKLEQIAAEVEVLLGERQ